MLDAKPGEAIIAVFAWRTKPIVLRRRVGVIHV
jgi:hypothetical protein